MDKKKTQQDYIKNIYKNGESLDKSQFSKKWIELINRLENSRSVKKQTRRYAMRYNKYAAVCSVQKERKRWTKQQFIAAYLKKTETN